MEFASFHRKGNRIDRGLYRCVPICLGLKSVSSYHAGNLGFLTNLRWNVNRIELLAARSWNTKAVALAVAGYGEKLIRAAVLVVGSVGRGLRGKEF